MTERTSTESNVEPELSAGLIAALALAILIFGGDLALIREISIVPSPLITLGVDYRFKIALVALAIAAIDFARRKTPFRGIVLVVSVLLMIQASGIAALIAR